MSGKSDAAREEFSIPESPFALGIDDLLRILRTDAESGLGASEAERRLASFGPNRLERGEEGNVAIRIFLRQFKNALIIILLIATIISGILGEVVDAIVIIVIIVLVAVLGFSQEYRTERVLSALRKLLSRTSRVVRNGTVTEVEIEELVPGDVVIVNAGDKIAADMRLMESFNLQTDEAVLTGESFPVQKTRDIVSQETRVADRTNMLFSGTSVTNGKGRAVVTATGMKTELGKIAQETVQDEKAKQKSSSLEIRMNEIGRKIGLIVLIIAVVIITVSVVQEYLLVGSVGLDTLTAILLFGVALAVAGIPEALPAVLVGSLAIGANRMAKSNALARNLSAVETLGVTQIVCSDKTGTLTKGEMTVREVYFDGEILHVSGVGYEPIGEVSRQGGRDPKAWFSELAKAMILCNDSTLMMEKDQGRWVIQGDPTEGAMVVLAEKMGQSQEKIRAEFQRIWEIPFSSETKRMTTVNRISPSERGAYMKGAPESILEVCNFMQTSHGIVPLDAPGKDRIRSAAESMASQALRVLGVCSRDVSQVLLEEDSIERDFTFLGLVGMIDPPRPEAIEAIRRAKSVGMQPIMITGDHSATALAIAKEMGIHKDGDMVVTGEDFSRMTEAEFDKVVERISVYARVTPSDKLKIVEGWKRRNKVVAMTGDGVNDAPALKRADIGIAMGITGTEVAKDASDLILMDDNFATIIKAVELGRWIQDNVKKYLAYLLSSNLVEVAVVSIGVLLASFLFSGNLPNGLLVPLLAVQLLYINLASDGLPALAVGIGPPDPDLMERKISPITATTIFSPDVRRFIIWAIIALTPLLTLIYFTGIPLGIEEARTRLFLAFVFSELALAFNCRSLRLGVSKAVPGRWLFLSVLWESMLLIVLLQIPDVRAALGLVAPTLGDIGWTALAAVLIFSIMEFVKLAGRRTRSSSIF